ncbi:MAG: SGNH/GDSL hydrolase family protein, partial [Xenococcaceae cyanobacterium]
TGYTIGNASINFTGATGRYHVKLGYFDERDGLATLDVQIGNHTSSLNLDQNLGHGGVSSQNLVAAEIFNNLEITTGETITITGVAEAAEWARVDYIEFIPLIDSSEPPISQSPTNGNDLLEGNSENNTINALDGNDIIKPGAGNNTINGGSGVDTISYDYDTAGVNVDLSNGIAVRKFTTTSDREFKILPLGDSNTRGYPNNSQIGGYRTNLWTGLTVDNNFNVNFVGAAASGPSNIDRDHEGRGAFTIDELTDNVNGKIGFNNSGAPIYTTIENALSDSPDMVLLMAGTNDLKNQGDTVNNALNELGTLVDRITVALPNTQVLVASILPNYSDAETTTKVEEFNSRIEDEVVNPRIANSDNVSFVDIFNSPLTTSDFDPDGTHLTQTGYDKVADVFLDAVLETKGGEDSLSNIENIIGSAYDDTLTGNAGSNIIDGGRGDDLLTGGAGSDTFVLSSQGDTDTILDFELGQDLFNLDRGITFTDLTITQGSGTSQNDSWIGLTDNSQTLAILKNIDSSLISTADFA